MNSLTNLYIKNFRSWDEFHIDDFNNKGLCLINGPNGSGKSSIRMAVEYLIMDSLLENISVSDLIKRGSDRFLISGVISSDKIIEIEKTRTHKKAIFKLVVDGNDIIYTNKKETQKELLNLLGITKDSLFFSCIFTNNSPSFVDAPDSERKDILYDFLNLWRFERYKEITKEFLQKITDQHLESKQELKLVESNINSLKSRIDELVEKSNSFKSEVESKVNLLKRKLASIDKIDGSDVENKIRELENELAKNQDINLLNAKYSKLEDTKYQITEVILKLEAKLQQLEDKKSDLSNNTCPVLGNKCNILDKEFSSKIVEIDKEINDIEAELEKFKFKSDNIDIDLNRIKEEVGYITELMDKLDDLEDRLREIRHHNAMIENERKNIKSQIRDIKNSENPYIELINNAYNEIKKLNEELELHKNDISKLEKLIPLYQFWIKGFGKQGIPNLEIERILGIIEDKTNEYLQKLSGKLSVRIEAQSTLKSGDVREKISYDVIHGIHRTPVNTLSGGEKQRIKIASILAFSDILRKFDFIILDEALDLSLDESGSEDVLKLLREKSSEVGSIFVMSHKTKIKNMFDNVIEVG